MPGPVQVYVATPAPPVAVAVSVIVPPAHIGLVAELTNELTDCGLATVTLDVVFTVLVHPVPG